MINTFHSSYNPPPVPPRVGYSRPHPVGNTPLVKFLSVMLLLFMILTSGGFIYLIQKLNVKELNGSYREDMTNLLRLEDCVNDKLGEDSLAECGKWIENYKAVIAKVLQANAKVSRLTGGPSFNGPAAHMVVQNQHKDLNSDFLKSKNLLWDLDDSLLKDVGLSNKRDMLTIQNPGTYFIYSQVTFSNHSKNALMQAVRTLPDPKKQEGKILLKSFCSLNPSKLSDMCTASMMGVFNLQKDQQIYVTVTNTSLVNRNFCNFGLFKLR